MLDQISLIRPLGGGGNGDCMLGLHRASRTHVVVKFLRRFDLPEARRYFKREVKVLAQRLRGLVPILHADVDGPRPYYVMLYLPGGAVTKHAGRLTTNQLRTIALDVAGTLADLHRQAIAHGDIKPDNILVADDGHLCLADPLGNGMGCTSIFSENRGGTPGYWAPEVRSGGEISQTGDVYSFGATLYHLASGQVPRDGQNLALPDSESISPVFGELVAICCQRDPTQRPSMADVVRILHGERWADIQRSKAIRAIAVLAAGVGVLALLSGTR